VLTTRTSGSTSSTLHTIPASSGVARSTLPSLHGIGWDRLAEVGVKARCAHVRVVERKSGVALTVKAAKDACSGDGQNRRIAALDPAAYKVYASSFAACSVAAAPGLAPASCCLAGAVVAAAVFCKGGGSWVQRKEEEGKTGGNAAGRHGCTVRTQGAATTRSARSSQSRDQIPVAATAAIWACGEGARTKYKLRRQQGVQRAGSVGCCAGKSLDAAPDPSAPLTPMG